MHCGPIPRRRSASASEPACRLAMTAAPRSVLVEVDQVAAGVVEHRVHAAVVPPPGLLDEHDPLGLEPLGLALAVVGAQRQPRPAGGLARWTRRAGSSARCSTSSTPSGSSGAITLSQRSLGP